MVDNQNPEEFAEARLWTRLGKLLPAEHHLIERFLQKDVPTVEAGTGGGRVLLEMQRVGFTCLSGFDFVPESIEMAKSHDPGGKIHFEVHDATRLGYGDATFSQAVYVQQILSYPSDRPRQEAMARESFRILKPGGTALFSVLCFNGKKSTGYFSMLYHLYVPFLRAMRLIRRSDRSIQSQPMKNVNERFNAGFFTDSGPFMYWYQPAEIDELLQSVGFVVDWVGARGLASEGDLRQSIAQLDGRLDSVLYLVVHKP